MTYTVLIAFNEVNRVYAKNTIQTFGEWTDDEKNALIPNLIKAGFIVENDVVVTPTPEQPVVPEAPVVQEPVFAHPTE